MNAASPAPLPAAIGAALKRSDEVSEWIGGHVPLDVPAGSPHVIAATCYAICMDHREAILLLVQHDARSAAFALWRSVYEALIRGTWAEQCATKQDVDQLATTQELPSLDTMIKRLDRLEPGAGDSSYSMTKLKVWKKMSHFAHGGLLQLARWAGPDGIGARHPDDEVVQLLWQIDIYGLLASMSVTRLAGLSTDEHEQKVRALLGES